MEHRHFAVAFVRAAAIALAAVWAGCARAPRDGGAPSPAVPDAISSAIARHFEETVAPGYGGEGEHYIPVVGIVALDDTDPADIRAWGDFEVWNYRLEGETFLRVSGGRYPGLFHLREADGACTVASFEPVPDGSGHLSGARRIFGKHFDAWQKLLADNAAREEERLRGIAGYAAARGLPAKFVQDYGWAPVPIPPPHVP